MKGKALTYTSDGELSIKHLDASPALEFLQQAVGGYIEAVPYFTTINGEPCVAFCNEEGKLKGLPINAVATKLWVDALNVATGSRECNDVLVGNVLVLTGDRAFLNSL